VEGRTGEVSRVRHLTTVVDATEDCRHARAVLHLDAEVVTPVVNWLKSVIIQTRFLALVAYWKFLLHVGRSTQARQIDLENVVEAVTYIADRCVGRSGKSPAGIGPSSTSICCRWRISIVTVIGGFVGHLLNSLISTAFFTAPPAVGFPHL